MDSSPDPHRRHNRAREKNFLNTVPFFFNNDRRGRGSRESCWERG